MCKDDNAIMSSTRRDKSVVGMEQRILTSTEECMMSYHLGMDLGDTEELSLENNSTIIDYLYIEMYLSKSPY